MKPIDVMSFGGGGGDPYFSYVVSLLHFDGTDASQTFTDVIGPIWTPFFDAQIDTAQSQFGGASGLFDGSGDRIARDLNINMGSDDFTIEAWIRPIGTLNYAIISNWQGDVTTYCAFVLYLNAGKLQLSYGVGATNAGTPSATSITSSVWTHVAACRQGETVSYYINGVKDSVTYSLVGSLNVPLGQVTAIGCISPNNAGGSLFFDGHIDELRVTKGIARYTADFTPPTAAFPDS